MDQTLVKYRSKLLLQIVGRKEKTSLMSYSRMDLKGYLWIYQRVKWTTVMYRLSALDV